MNTNNISEGINRLKNRIDEALNRSASATLNSHRGLSATLEAAPQQTETYKTASHYTNETDLYRSVQNYQVKSIHGFEPNYISYQGFVPAQSYVHPVQPLIIPYGHQYPVQEVRSATYGYESYHLASPTHFYQPLEYVDDYEGNLSQRNQSSGKKKSIKGRKQDLQNDDDSFSKDPKKTQPQSNNAAPQNQAAQQTQPPKQNQPAQQNPPQQNQSAPQNQAAQQTQPPKQNQPAQQNPPQQNQPAQQNQQQTQPPKQNQLPQNGQAQQNQQPIDNSNLVLLPKKPYLIDTYNFGQEKRRGGSQRI